MIILIGYVFILAMLVLVGVVLRFRSLKSQHRLNTFMFSSNKDDSVDKNVDSLCIESAGSMVSSHALSRRGSWRVALNQVMSGLDFEEMKSEEYRKNL